MSQRATTRRVDNNEELTVESGRVDPTKVVEDNQNGGRGHGRQDGRMEGVTGHLW